MTGAPHIRAAHGGDEHAIAQLHVHSWQCTYTGIDPDETLKTVSIEERRQHWADAISDAQGKRRSKAIFVAEENGIVVGFICGGEARKHKLQKPADYDAELYAIYVETARQGRGIGQQLFSTLQNWLSSHGFKHMILWAFADNPFLPFYPKLGGVPGDETRINTSLGTPLKIISFVWRDLDKDAKKYG